MRLWAILISLNVLVMGMVQDDLQAQSVADIKELKKQFKQYVQKQGLITDNIVRKASKDGEKDLVGLWAAASWYEIHDRIKESVPWNKDYDWQPSDNLTPLERSTTSTTTTTAAGTGGGGGGGGR